MQFMNAVGRPVARQKGEPQGYESRFIMRALRFFFHVLLLAAGGAFAQAYLW